MADSSIEFLEYIPDDEIRDQADLYREEICPGGEVPLDIFNIIEFDLDIEIVPTPNLKTSADTETVLLSDFKTILVDNDEFLDTRYENRIKFSLAHELGHIQLHKDLVKNFFPSSIDEYVDIMQSITESQYGRFEFQAYEFAGRLLVPKEKLVDKLKEHKDDINEFLERFPGGETYLPAHLATNINDFLGVSSKVVEKRIVKEGVDLKNL